MAIDKNAKQLVCVKYRPLTPGNPYYFFGAWTTAELPARHATCEWPGQEVRR